MSEKIKITFLGTAGAVPSAERNHPAVLLNYKDENILFDCGEGTQRQFRKAGLNPCKITKLLISHWHGDHVLGIPGLLQTLAFSGYNKKLFIYGPRGTKKFMELLLRTFVFLGKIKIEIQEIENGKFVDTPDFYLESGKVSHGILCNAYSFVEKTKLRIDKKKLEKVKLPLGPILKKLKEGKNIIYEGKKYLARDLTVKGEGKKISVVMDTSINKNIISFVKNSDLLICEATFSQELNKKAEEYKHLTSKQAAEIAKKSKSKKLFLTHLSQRHDRNQKKILEESKKIFNNSFLARDLETIEI